MFMEQAIEEARKAEAIGEVPIGAILVYRHEIIARSGNRIVRDFDPTAHAEISVLREAGEKLKTPRLVECDFYTTLEPCPMCAQALSFARIRRLYFGAYDPKGGGIDHGPQIFNQKTCHHKPEIYGGIMEKACSHLLSQFFQSKRVL